MQHLQCLRCVCTASISCPPLNMEKCWLPNRLSRYHIQGVVTHLTPLMLEPGLQSLESLLLLLLSADYSSLFSLSFHSSLRSDSPWWITCVGNCFIIQAEGQLDFQVKPLNTCCFNLLCGCNENGVNSQAPVVSILRKLNIFAHWASQQRPSVSTFV